MVPFAAAEAEGIGQLAAQSGPELVALFSLGHNVEVVVQPLELLVVLGHLGVRLALRRPSSRTTATAFALVLSPILLHRQSPSLSPQSSVLTPLFPRGMIVVCVNQNISLSTMNIVCVSL